MTADEQILELNDLIQVRDNTIAMRDTAIASKDDIISERTALILEYEDTLQQLRAQIADLEACDNYQSTIGNLEEQISQLEEELAAANAAHADCDDTIATLNAQVDSDRAGKELIADTLANKGLDATHDSTYEQLNQTIADYMLSAVPNPLAPIGYDISDILPATINEDVAYTLSVTPDPSATAVSFQNNTQLVYCPQIQLDTPLTSMDQMFYYCSSLTAVPQFDTSSVTSMNYMFFGCLRLTSVPQFDTSSVTNMSGMFQECQLLTTVPQFDTSSVRYMDYMFNGCQALTTVPQFDTSSVTSMKYMFYYCSSLRQIELRNLGTAASLTALDLSTNYNLGEDNEEFPEARQKLVDTLLTYSFDRAAAGYSNMTITLDASTKARLTAEEIAAIEAKGYTLN